MVDQLVGYFKNRDFLEVPVNIPNVSVFYSNQDNFGYLIVLLSLPTGSEFTKEQKQNIEYQLQYQMAQRMNQPIKLLTFVCTDEVELVSELYKDNDHTAVIDTASRRLLLFEGQAEDPLGIYKDIEQILVVPHQEKRKLRLRDITAGIGIMNASIVLINVVVFLWIQIFGLEYDALNDAALFWVAVVHNHEYYRLFTSMFLHLEIDHLLYNMLTLSVIGNTLEKMVGKVRYLVIYLTSGVIAGMVSMSYNMEKDVIVRSLGASGAIFGVIGAVLFIVLRNKGKVENLGKKQMILFVALSLYGGFTSTGVDNVAHVGGLIGGIILALLLYRKHKKRGVIS